MEENKENIVNKVTVEQEIKLINKKIKREADLMQKNKSSASSTANHIERIIDLHNQLFKLKEPTGMDKANLSILKIQYRTLCAIAGRKADKLILKGN